MTPIDKYEDFDNELNEAAPDGYFETTDFRKKVNKSLDRNMGGKRGVEKMVASLVQDAAIYFQDDDPDALKNFMGGTGTPDDLKELGDDYFKTLSDLLNKVLSGIRGDEFQKGK